MLISPINLQTVSNETFRHFMQAIYQCIDNGDIAGFRLCDDLISERLLKSIHCNNVQQFENFSGLYVWYFNHLIEKKLSLNNHVIYKECAERAAQGLRLKSDWTFGLSRKKIEIQDWRRMNSYNRILVDRNAQLINICLRNKDLLQLKLILNELQQTSRGYRHDLVNLKYSIQFKRSESLNSTQQNELKLMEERYVEESFLDDSVRLLFKATFFWSYFLYRTQTIELEVLKNIESIFQSYQGYINHDYFNDLIRLTRLRSGRGYSWSDWDYMERPSGVTFSPPEPQVWAPLGAILYALKQNLPFLSESEEYSIEKLKEQEHLYSSMQKVVKSIEADGFKIWGELLGRDNEEQFQRDLAQELIRYQRLENSIVAIKEKQLATIPIDQVKVESFKQIMRTAWEDGNDLRKIFGHFDKIKTLSLDSSEQLYLVGVKNQVWLGHKSSLVKDENYFIPIYGIERYGESLIDSEETLFFSIFEKHEQVDSEHILEEVNNSIERLKKKGYKPSLILCGMDIWYDQFDPLKSSDFVRHRGEEHKEPLPVNGGKYKDIPIVYFTSRFINNRLIVCDFKAALSLVQKEVKEGYKGVMKLDINEITKEKAIQIIEGNPDYWKSQLQENALVKLQNSILVDFYMMENFLIDNTEALSVITAKH